MPLSQFQMAQPGISQLGQVANQIAVGLARQNYQRELFQQQMAMRRAELASQQALDRQRAGLYGAQTRETEAQTELHGARTGQIEDLQRAKSQLGDAGWLLGMVQAGQNQGIDMGPRQDIAIAQALSAMGQLPDAARSRYPENVAQTLQLPDPRFQQFLGLGQRPMVNVAPGATSYDAFNQRAGFQSPRVLNQGQTLVPGSGGESIAQGIPPRPAASNLGQLFGPLVGLRGQGMVSGVPIESNNPTFQATDAAIQALIPLLMQQATNFPTLPPSATQAEVPLPSSTSAPVGLPRVGEIRKGYRFKGGNPGDKNNWEKVQ